MSDNAVILGYFIMMGAVLVTAIVSDKGCT